MQETTQREEGHDLSPEKLTEKQLQLLEFIISQVRESSLPPSVSEMAKFLKVKSKNAVTKLLAQLQDKGYVSVSGKARGIKVLNSIGQSMLKGMFRAPVLGNIQAGLPMLAEENVEDWINLPDTLHWQQEVA